MCCQCSPRSLGQHYCHQSNHSSPDGWSHLSSSSAEKGGLAQCISSCTQQGFWHGDSDVPCWSSWRRYRTQLLTLLRWLSLSNGSRGSITCTRPLQHVAPGLAPNRPQRSFSAKTLSCARQWLRRREFCWFCKMTGEAGNSELLDSKFCYSSYEKPWETIWGLVTSEKICQHSYSSYRKVFY